MLNDLEWGVEKTFNIHGILRDLAGKDNLLLTFKAGVCLDAGSCSVKTILENFILPKPGCNWNLGFLNSDFNYNNWLKEHGLSVGTELKEYARLQLLNTLGVSDFLLKAACDNLDLQYFPQQYGWKTKECSTKLTGLPQLPPFASCRILESCTAIDCCINFEEIGQTFHFTLDIDLCKNTLIASIEGLKVKWSLQHYVWGTEETISLHGLARLKFSLKQDSTKMKIILNAGISFCLSPEVSCNTEISISNVILPKPGCGWKLGYLDSGLTLTKFITSHGLSQSLTQLTTGISSLLMEKLGILQYMSNSQCNPQSYPYTPNVDGWNKQACSMSSSVNLPSLSGHNIFGALSSSCTALDLCLEVPLLARTLHAFLRVDYCFGTVSFGIDDYSVNVGLEEFSFSTRQNIWLNGVLRLDFIIDDLKAESVFLVSLNVSVCIDPSICQVQEVVLHNTKLPKTPCNWKTDFIKPDFSLSTWLENNVEGGKLTESLRKMLLDELGLSNYLLSTPCQGDIYTFGQINQDNWSQVCKKNVSLPFLPKNMMCSLSESCTAVDCCLNAAEMLTSFRTSLHIDPCNQQMTISVEKLSLTLSLIDYVWGTQESFWLFGVVRVNSSVYYFEDEGIFRVNLDIALCSSRDSCRTFPIFNQIALPVPVCSTAFDFATPGFSLTTWLKEKGQKIVNGTLDKVVTNQLLEELELARFLVDFPCDPTQPPYSGAVGRLRNKCPKEISNLPNLIGTPVTCAISENCLGVECCMEVPMIAKNLRVYIKVDPCLYRVQIGIEAWEFTLSLLTYKWGQEERYWLQGAIRVNFSLFDLETDGVYLFNLGVSMCLSKDGCEFSVPLFKNTRLPKPLCTWDAGFFIPGFDLTSWLSSKGLAVGQEMGSLVKSKLYQDLGIASFMSKPQCVRNEGVYANATSDGWKHDCSRPISLQPLPSDHLTCHIPSSCNQVDCCLDIPEIGASFSLLLRLDSCQKKLTVGIDKLTYDLSLLNDSIETKNHLYLLGLVKLDYEIVNLIQARKYVVSLNMSYCLSSASTGCHTIKILDRAEMPNLLCQLELNFVVQDFSFTLWKKQQGLPIIGNLAGDAVDMLLETMGLSPYLKSPQCNRAAMATASSAALDQGWLMDCSKVQRPSSLDGKATTCRLANSCMGVECCMDVAAIGRSFSAYIYIDPCNLRMMVGIEDLQFNISLLNYEWNKKEQFYLFGVVRIDFRVEDLPADRMYLVNMELNICLESRGYCQMSMIIFLDTLLPKPTCRWDKGFLKPDFSLNGWLNQHNLDPNMAIPEKYQNWILEETGLASFLKSKSCQFSETRFTPVDAKSWNTQECNATLQLPDLSGYTAAPLTCHITDMCTALECCVNVMRIGRTIEISAYFDTCNFVMKVGIENYIHSVSLFDYQWGQQESVWLLGIFRLDYRIYNFDAQKIFVANMSLSICYESSASCVIRIPILQNTQLQKVHCDWSFGFTNPTFSIKDWYANIGQAVGSSISEQYLRLLLEDIGISRYLLDSQNSCNHTQDKYKNSTNGWTNACSLDSSVAGNSKLSGSETVCNIPSFCTGVECCTTVPELFVNLHTKVFVDACKKVLSVAIEKMTFEISLLDYQWGKNEEVSLQGVVKLSFSISDLPSAQVYIINLDLKICLSAMEDCVYKTTIFQNTRLPKPLCNWSSGFILPDFSLTAWKISQGVTSLSSLNVAQLMETLGIAAYLLDTSCSFTSEPFKLATIGQIYTERCPLTIGNLSSMTMTANLKCSLMSSCTGLECCIHSQLLDKSFYTIIDLDTCLQTLSFGIEKIKYQISLLNYQWGTRQKYYLNGVVRLDYAIKDLPGRGQYLMNMSVSICLEATKPCEYSIEILTNTLLTKRPCQLNTTFLNPDFSLSVWMAERGLSPYRTFEEYYISEILDRLGLAQYMSSPQCSRKNDDNRFAFPTAGWTKSCSKVNTLEVENPSTCHIMKSCTGVECCTDVSHLARTFHTYLELDACSNTLTVGIEKLQFVLSLDETFKWEEEQEMCLFGVVCIRYTITDLKWENSYLVSFGISVCFDPAKPDVCITKVSMMKNVKMPKPLCDSQQGYLINGFSLDSWMQSHGLPASMSSLPSYITALLMEDLGVAIHLSKTQCDRSKEPYISAASSGFRTDQCGHSLILNPISSDPVTCVISPLCTGVTCCIDVPLIGRSIQAHMNLDICNGVLTVGIETLTQQKSLLDYEWGRKDHFFLLGLVRLDFSLVDFPHKNIILADLTMSICFNKSNAPCSYAVPIFSGVQLPKQICSQKTDYLIPNFNLTKWQMAKGYSLGSLDSMQVSKLLEDIGIAAYLDTEQCKTSVYPYSDARNGWNIECGNVIPVNSLPEQLVCNIPDYCTGISCCLSIPRIGRSVKTYLSINTCDLTLTVGIDRLRFTVNLFDYTWDTDDHLYMRGVIRVDYKIKNLLSSRKFLLDLKLSICFNDTEGECYLQQQLFSNTILSAVQCDYNHGFALPNFTFGNWLKAAYGNIYDSSINLPTLVQDRLLEQLGISPYLLSDRCSHAQVPYSQVNGNRWKSDCPLSLLQVSLGSSMACHVDSSCLAVDCCVDMGRIESRMQQTFLVILRLDPCNHQLTVGIEKMKFEISLLSYKFGEMKTLDLEGLVKMQFNILDLAATRQYMVSLKVSVCLDYQANCTMTTPIFQNALLNKLPCTVNSTFINSSISLTTWLTENGITQGQLTNLDMAYLMRYLGIAPYVLDNPCNATNLGWNKECSLPIELPDISLSPLSCTIPSHCTAAKCCFNVEDISSSLYAAVDINFCTAELTISLEKLTYTVPLLDFDFNKIHQYYLQGILRIQ
ncbi:hypothetical protein CHS0354_035943 [Potamilus streckersoni]|uniref:Uncharacterized protein n=1 Tax=Potamilus streckersoni TaxID=2493646 RepID=A0AAE0WBX9_9BIVA|nr:hypothetical protein CHS0354_035943 [Potamilus streckersoni]